MSDKMRPIPFRQLLHWIAEEYRQHEAIFGIPKEKFFKKTHKKGINIFGDSLAAPIGPAAGPNTQLAQNIVAAYLTGSRFFELKTVQVLDELEFPKPCISAEDECYNTEWSTELSIEGAFEEYIKAWFLLHVIQREYFDETERDFAFNISVGYDLAGIKTPKVDGFIEGMKDASETEIFQQCKNTIAEMPGSFQKVDRTYLEGISSVICNSITLSTLHGCPPREIEAISRYLLQEKKLHTLVKMNPTLLGYNYVRKTLNEMGYDYIQLKEESFSHDLQYEDGIAMLKRLKLFAAQQKRIFGVKLSNTLPVRNTTDELPGEEKYMSGRALYPLTINLAYKIAVEFAGKLIISYSGGADFFNISRIFKTGIAPITLATTLLKPGGYLRLTQIAGRLETQLEDQETGMIDLQQLKILAEDALQDQNYLKENKAKRCKIPTALPLFDCFTAPCKTACPIGQDIPEYIRLTKEGRFDEAFAVITAKNPLPFITGTICNHNCMTKCTRLDYDESVKIRDIKLIASQKGAANYLDKKTAAANKSAVKTAIIGAGPAGLAAGYFLARAGIDVTIFDAKGKAGGTVANIIPEFRIPAEAIANDLELIKRTGVKFKLGINPDFSVTDIKALGYDYIFLAIGASKSLALQLESDGRGMQTAINFLEEFKMSEGNLTIGKNVAVIGGGNSAMDAARAAKRVHGVENVFIIYRRTREYMPADDEELEAALNDGVVFKELLSPVAFNNGRLKCQKTELGREDEFGRRKPVAKAGEFIDLEIDTLLTAIGEQVDKGILTKNGIEIDKDGKVAADPLTNETNIANVFIGGDALSGPSTVVKAIAQGKKVAEAIIKKVVGDAAVQVPLPENSFDETQRLTEITAKKGILRNGETGIAETARCLECNFVCNICAEVCPNRANTVIKPEGKYFKKHNQIIHLDGMCNECGNCAVFCPYEGAPYRNKLTLFWNEKDFKNSSNQGFLLAEEEGMPSFILRLNNKTSVVKFDERGETDNAIPEEIKDVLWTMYTRHKYLFKK